MAQSIDMQNLGEFWKLIEFIEEDPGWNSPNQLLKLNMMKDQHADCLATVEDIPVKQAPNKMAINERDIAYKAVFPKKITRSMRIYKSNQPSEQAFADAQTYSRKATGKRKSKLAVDNPDTPADEAAKNHSASEQGHESLLGHLRNLIQIYTNDPKYVTNEAGFSVAELTADGDNLEVKNAAVAETFAPLSTSRIARDNKMYLNADALFTVQNLATDFAAGRYGTDDPRFKRINKLKFTFPSKLR